RVGGDRAGYLRPVLQALGGGRGMRLGGQCRQDTDGKKSLPGAAHVHLPPRKCADDGPGAG
ncbi:hypothetical protein B8W90_13805, partial [Staphylococcus hominis]